MQMQDDIILDGGSEQVGYQVIAVNIKWDRDTVSQYRGKKSYYDRLPEQITVTLPESLAQKHSTPEFYDLVESWTYGFLVKRFNHIANHCQVFLPLD
jgi:hypothetical protein